MVHAQKLFGFVYTSYCPLPTVVVHQTLKFGLGFYLNWLLQVLTWGHPQSWRNGTENGFLLRNLHFFKTWEFQLPIRKLQGEVKPLQQNLKVQNPKGFTLHSQTARFIHYNPPSPASPVYRLATNSAAPKANEEQSGDSWRQFVGFESWKQKLLKTYEVWLKKLKNSAMQKRNLFMSSWPLGIRYPCKHKTSLGA